MASLKNHFYEASKKNKYGIPHKRNKLNDCKWNVTGFYNVYVCFKKEKAESWKYVNEYFGEEIIFDNIVDLRDEVVRRRWPWYVNDYYYARKTAKLVNLPLYDLKKKVNYKKIF